MKQGDGGLDEVRLGGLHQVGLHQGELGRAFFQLLLKTSVVMMLVALLWLLHVFGRLLPDAFWMVVVLAMAGVIAFGGFQRRRSRRAAFLAAYMQVRSPWQLRLRGGVLMALVQVLLGLFWAVVLCIGVLRLQSVTVWWLLLVNLPILVLVQAGIQQSFAGHVSARFLPEWSWRISLWVMMLVILPGMLAVSLYAAYPEFAGVSLDRAVWHLMDQERARSAWLQNLLQLAAAKDALRYWLAQQWIPTLAWSAGEIAMWLLILLDEVLLVWPCLLLCQGALISVERYES